MSRFCWQFFVLAVLSLGIATGAHAQAVGGACTTGNTAGPDANGYPLKCVASVWALAPVSSTTGTFSSAVSAPTGSFGNIVTTGYISATGPIYSRGYNAGSATSIDFSQGNIAYTTAVCGAFTLTNMQDGGSYMLVVQGSGTGPATFSHTGLTVKTTGTLTCTSAKHTVFSFIRVGTNAYVTMVTGY